MVDKDFKAFYSMLKKKFKLPPLDTMDNAFEISFIEPGPFFLRDVVRRMSEHIDFNFTILNKLLHPQTKIWEIREANTFDDAAKQRIYGLYKKVKYHFRFSDEALIDGSNEACARFINSFIKDYPSIRKQMLEIVREMKITWQKEITEKTDLGYLG